MNRVLVFLVAFLLTAAAGRAQLSGGYTIGPGASFPDMTAAVSALTSQGVSGPVQFLVLANQTGSWTISAFPGQGALNPVVFEGGGLVTLSGALPMLILSGCHSVIFNGFDANFPLGEAIRVENNATECVFSNCNLLMPVTTSTTTNRIFSFTNAVNCRVEDSHFGGGYHAFLATGGNGCTVQRCRMLGGGWRICETSSPNFTFQNNFVYGNSNFGFIVNPGSLNLKIYNNSFYIVHVGTTTQYCSLRWYTTDYTEVLNNVFYNVPVVGQGFIMWCSGTNRPTVMDYNVYNLVSGISHVYHGAVNHTMASWQGLGNDANSIEADPMYANTAVSPPDLHITASSPCFMAGTLLATVIDDIDGNPRTPPYDIGAHEVPTSGLFAIFSANITSGPAPLLVNFIDQTFTSDPGGVLTWSWDFGDGSPLSTLQNPSHTYSCPGNYTVTLTVSDSLHPPNTMIRSNFITVGNHAFTMTTSGGGVGDLIINPVPTACGPATGAVRGWTLPSLTTTQPAGTGPLFGMVFDPVSFQFLLSPANVGTPAHFLVSPPAYPDGGPLVFPAGFFAPLAGISMDGVMVFVSANGNLLHWTNVSRVTF